MRSKKQDLTGLVYGQLTVLQELPSNGKYTRWLCRCDCGKEKSIISVALRQGTTVSCGCYGRKNSSQRNSTHGMSKSPEYYIWDSMKQRCCNAKSKGFKAYGGKGISLCDEWLSFDNFFADMGNRPDDKSQIDRIDNNKGYSKENCRWVSMTENCRNKGNNRLITYNNVTKCMSAWAEETGLKRVTIQHRLNAGWSDADAITKPLRGRRATLNQLQF